MEDPGFHARVAAGYRELAGEVEGLVRIGAVGGEEEVHRRIVEALAARFPETFFPAGFTSREPGAALQWTGARPPENASEKDV